MKTRLSLPYLHFSVLLFFAVFLMVQVLKIYSCSRPEWVFHHLNDFLAIPIVATVCLHGVWLVKNNTAIRLSLFTLFSLAALFSVFFEYYLPTQSFRYTGDFLDVICYFAGALVFYLLQKLN